MKTLSPIETQLLSLVLAKELSGRDVAKLYKAETGRSISYGTLYTTFRRLKEGGLVNARDDEDEDGRVRYFSATGQGKCVLNETRAFYESRANFGLGDAIV